MIYGKRRRLQVAGFKAGESLYEPVLPDGQTISLGDYEVHHISYVLELGQGSLSFRADPIQSGRLSLCYGFSGVQLLEWSRGGRIQEWERGGDHSRNVDTFIYSRATGIVELGVGDDYLVFKANRVELVTLQM